MKKSQLYVLAALFIAAGLTAFFYKWKVLKFPVHPVEQSEVWELQARVEYQPRSGPNRVVLQVPIDPPGYSILDERFVARGYGMNTERRREQRSREVQWTIRRASGSQALYYRATVFRDGTPSPERDRPQLASPPELEEPFAGAAAALLETVRAQSVDSATFAARLIQEFNDANPGQEVALLLQDRRGDYDRVRFAIDLLAIRNIAARLVHGVRLDAATGQGGELRPWLQVYDTSAGVWHTIDPRSASIGWPEDLFLWSRHPGAVLEVEGSPRARFDIRVQKSMVDSLEAAVQRLEVRDRNLVAYSLLALPLHTQDVYRILLMVPIGAFIMLILRNLVGVKTFGTFMPVLIAISFKWTSLLAGIVLFVLIVGMGLLVRFYMERLKLLLVPRLTSVLIVVVLLMALVSVLSNKMGLEVGLSIALFPMIIMTMTIERVSVAWDERGGGFAMKMAAGSLVIASLAYLVMSWPPLEHLLFVYPELLLVLLGLTLLLGRYSGYRLTELMRFRALARPQQDG
ncbi:MAG: inactive transglutaminase family protein [Xanthomonadales bacterium]|nr:inactive transglutaminase family protein [Xanthomonadales bacterium]